ncbi:MAG: DUF167 domain-containing protein [Microgenomates group bacterium]
MKYLIIAHPNAKKPRIEKDLLRVLRVYVHEPPLEGKANHAVILALAEYFHVHKRNVQLITGATGKHKIVEIQ